SIGMCIGATLAGSRAMTATSGPGISLYSENIGLAIMGEVPLVIVDVQRLGPATGGATTVSQGDVQFVRWGTAGGFPIIALTPSTVPEAYHLTMRAFALAERFRTPVFLLTDKELATTLTTVDGADFVPVAVPPRHHDAAGSPYRYVPGDGVHPLHEFGRGTAVRFTGSTHDEAGFITKHLPTVEALNRHLIDKIEAHRTEIELVDADLDPDATTLLLGYGITGGAVRAAVARARREGRALSGVVVQSLWPIPETALTAAMTGVDRVVVAELNPGLYRREVERIAAGRTVVGVERLDGELLSVEQILEAA
ncbi:MAG TPA: pyruvate flavodoxin/ferredoxin oxidoreductase, partial [Acidimicrobiia bacterium]|nr:pyruvate flavodoxin/ferredoxin oxidoreductase [Acidimicrobiia bacterium]